MTSQYTRNQKSKYKQRSTEMYLRKNKSGYELVKAIRINGKPRTKFICYLGQLDDLEKTKILLILKSKSLLDFRLIQHQNKDLKVFKEHLKIVTNVQIRPNTFKKVINKEWLENAYRKEKLSISAIAQLLGIHRDRVRDNLKEHGIISDNKMELFESRDTHPEFGKMIVDGKKVLNPIELEFIKKMFEWRQKGTSFQKIADLLTEAKIKGKLGSDKWDRGTVRRVMIRNKNLVNLEESIPSDGCFLKK